MLEKPEMEIGGLRLDGVGTITVADCRVTGYNYVSNDLNKFFTSSLLTVILCA